ncbi:MAG TPA: hypothetical protein VFS00_02420, partial [Polyangiaceae bacterium]|nr:hypothetical protein [Polyangiaceae bacterium]
MRPRPSVSFGPAFSPRRGLARALTALALALPLGASSLGCATGGAAGPAAAKTSPVPDEQFASAVAALLRSRGTSDARPAQLTAVVQRQLIHAGERLAARQRERGLAGVYGALFLVRKGELR